MKLYAALSLITFFIISNVSRLDFGAEASPIKECLAETVRGGAGEAEAKEVETSAAFGQVEEKLEETVNVEPVEAYLKVIEPEGKRKKEAVEGRRRIESVIEAENKVHEEEEGEEVALPKCRMKRYYGYGGGYGGGGGGGGHGKCCKKEDTCCKKKETKKKSHCCCEESSEEECHSSESEEDHCCCKKKKKEPPKKKKKKAPPKKKKKKHDDDHGYW